MKRFYSYTNKKIPAYILFLFSWSTLVYDFVAYWTWAPNGWLRGLEVLDFAGGSPVHITSGFSALAYALVVGPRRTVDFKNVKPHSPSNVFLGTALLWFGWFGFNGGSELAINSRAGNAVIVSNLSASFGGISWMVIEMIVRRKFKFSLNGFCCGAIAGLVGITPASGYVRPHFAIVFGLLCKTFKSKYLMKYFFISLFIKGGILCFFASYIKKLTKYKYDDACDVFAGNLRLFLQI